MATSEAQVVPPPVLDDRPRDAAGSQAALNRGNKLAEAGDIDGSIAAFEEAVERNPNNADAVFRLAYVLDQRGEDARAVTLYESLASRPVVMANVLLNLAVLYEDRGDYEAAAHCCKRVLAAYPNHTRACLFLKDAESSLDMYYDEDQERVREKHNAVLDIPVTDFELSVRSRNCLKKMNINCLGDLLRITEPELLGYKNFGETSLSEIKAMLKMKGLQLGQHVETRQTASQQEALRKVAPSAPPEVLSKPVSELELSVRSRKCLQRLDLSTVGELAMQTEAELLGTKNFGQTSLNEIKQRLAEHGLSLRKVDD